MKRKRRPPVQKKLVRGGLVGVGTFLLSWLLHLLGVFQPLEWKSWDLRSRLWAEPGRADPNVVIFLIDQYSLDVYEKEQGLAWPWPRQLYSAVIDYLGRGGAKAIFFDLDFSAHSRSGREDDEDFARAMTRSGNVFLPLSLSLKEESYEATPPSRLERFSLPTVFPSNKNYPEARSTSLPVSPLVEACRGAGNVVFPPDSDGIFRRLPLAFLYRGIAIPSLPLALARFLKEERAMAKVPLDEQGRMILRFHGPSGTYKTYSIAAIINSWAQLEEGLDPQIDPKLFAGKVVLVGGSAPGLLDLRPTPLSAVSAGVEIQAVALDNLLHGDSFRNQPAAILVGFLLILSLSIAFAASLIGPIGLQVVLLLAGLALPWGAIWLAFRSGMWLNFAVLEFAVVTSSLASSLLNYAVEGRQRRFIRNVFSHYLSPEVIDRIVANPGLLRLGGERREVTSFFSDVEGFTSISERLSPEDLVHFLNDYLSEMTEIILASGGTLDKYEGDAIIAFWNAPLDQPDHALRACQAALKCQERLEELRPRFIATIGRPIKMRIGLNSGPAVVGNMGSKRRFDYTAMGDTINLAARMEGACKIYHVSILAGEETYRRVREEILVREVDTIRVVGREQPVSVYEMIGEKGQIAADFRERVRWFEEGREFYKQRDWERAIAQFKKLAGDPLAELYLDRCLSLQQNPPLQDWDGVFVLRQK